MQVSDYLKIFEVLANSSRIEIMQNLIVQSMKLGQLSKKMDSSIQGLQRHVDKLLDASLILKNSDGEFSVSPIGVAVLNQISAFEFLSKHKDYFKNHNFGDLPSEFIQRIGDLNESQFISSTMDNWQHAKNFQLEAKEYLCGISHILAIEFFEFLIDMLKKGVKFSAILGENTIIPKGFFEKIGELDLEQFAKKGLINQRMIPKVSLTVVITENEAMVSFPKMDGNVDDSSSFVSKDKKFHQWCMDVFNYYLDKSNKFDPSKLKIQ